MKQLATWCLLLFAFELGAQISGEILYEEKFDIHRNMTGERAQYRDMVPQFITNKMVLFFNQNESLYKAQQDPNAAIPNEDVDMSRRGNRWMRFRQRRNKQVVYLNFVEHLRVETREMFDKEFLIVDEPEHFAWKLTGESMKVGEFVAQEATYQDSTIKISTWFTSQIPVPAGPGRYGQLPGMILHIDINDGERTITAIGIQMKDLDPDDIVRPTQGKEVSQAEFDALMKERREEFRAMRGSRGFRNYRGN